MPKKLIIPQHTYDAEMKKRKKAKTPHIRINYMADPIPEEDLPDYLLDEIKGFNKAFNISVDENGFVVGDLTPADANVLAYKLIAWVVLGEKK